jgi:hypothetical protein
MRSLRCGRRSRARRFTDVSSLAPISSTALSGLPLEDPAAPPPVPRNIPVAASSTMSSATNRSAPRRSAHPPTGGSADWVFGQDVSVGFGGVSTGSPVGWVNAQPKVSPTPEEAAIPGASAEMTMIARWDTPLRTPQDSAAARSLLVTRKFTLTDWCRRCDPESNPSAASVAAHRPSRLTHRGVDLQIWRDGGIRASAAS